MGDRVLSLEEYAEIEAYRDAFKDALSKNRVQGLERELTVARAEVARLQQELPGTPLSHCVACGTPLYLDKTRDGLTCGHPGCRERLLGCFRSMTRRWLESSLFSLPVDSVEGNSLASSDLARGFLDARLKEDVASTFFSRVKEVLELLFPSGDSRPHPIQRLLDEIGAVEELFDVAVLLADSLKKADL